MSGSSSALPANRRRGPKAKNVPATALDGGIDAQDLKPELLARLGLSRQASDQEIERVHQELVDFLDGAPQSLQPWARREFAQAEAIHALLSNTAHARPEWPQRGTAASDSLLGAAVSERDVMQSAEADELLEEYEREPAPRRARKGTPRRPVSPGRARLAKRVLVVALVVAGIGGIGFAVYHWNWNGGSSIPGISGKPDTSAASSTQLDTAQVAKLMAKLKTSPNDVPTLLALGNLYFNANDFASATQFMKQVVAIEPKNVTALLALGAGDFNSNQNVQAEQEWLQVVAIDPNNVEAHYDLGFLYLSGNPPDMAKVKAEWNKVIAIAPNSDVAKTVAAHLQSLASSSPAASGG